jgi:uncharacterized protein YndB with AHSA1/START domain
MTAPGASAESDLWPSFERAEQAMNEFGVVTAARTIRFQRVLPGPIERVWAYLTESDKRSRWLAAGPMELSVGGRVELTFHHADFSTEAAPAPERFSKPEGGPTVQGRVTRCEPPRLLSYTWDGGSGDPSEVTFELSARGEDVLLVLTHRSLGRKAMGSVGPGWHAHLGVLAEHLAGRTPRPFWPVFTALEEEYRRRLPVE